MTKPEDILRRWDAIDAGPAGSPSEREIASALREALRERDGAFAAADAIASTAAHLAGDLDRRWTKGHPHRRGHLDPLLEALAAHGIQRASARGPLVRPVAEHAFMNGLGEIYVVSKVSESAPNPGMREGAWCLMVRKDEFDEGRENDFYWLHEDGADHDQREFRLVADLGDNENLPIVDADRYEDYKRRKAVELCLAQAGG